MKINRYKPNKTEAQLIYEVTEWLLKHDLQPPFIICHYLSECFSVLAEEIETMMKNYGKELEQYSQSPSSFPQLPEKPIHFHAEKAFHFEAQKTGPPSKLKRNIWIAYRFGHLIHSGIPINTLDDFNDGRRNDLCDLVKKEVFDYFGEQIENKGIIPKIFRDMLKKYPFLSTIIDEPETDYSKQSHKIPLYIEYVINLLTPHFSHHQIPNRYALIFRGKLISSKDKQFTSDDILDYCTLMTSYIFRIYELPRPLVDYTIKIFKTLSSPYSSANDAFTSASNKTTQKKLQLHDRNYGIAFDVFELISAGYQFLKRDPADQTETATDIVGRKHGLAPKTVAKIYKTGAYRKSIEGTYEFSMTMGGDDAWKMGKYLYFLENRNQLRYSTPSEEPDVIEFLLQKFFGPDGSLNPPEVTRALLDQHFRRTFYLLPETTNKLAAHTTAIIYASLDLIKKHMTDQEKIYIECLPQFTSKDFLYLSKIRVSSPERVSATAAPQNKRERPRS